MVLGGCPDEGYAPDIDLFDRIGEAAGGIGNGLLEGVEVDDHHVDGDIAEGCDFLQVGAGAPRKDAAMDGRMEGFYPSPEDFARAGVVGDLADGDAGIEEGACRAARGKERPAQLRKPGREIDESGLVMYGQDCVWHGFSLLFPPSVLRRRRR